MRRAGKVSVGMLVGAMALAGAGCDPGALDGRADGGASAEDGGLPGLDASLNGSGLTVLWASEPMPVAQVGEDVELSEVQLQLRDVRAIGDAAPGDRRTSVEALELRWRAGEQPQALFFPDAPLGLYSRFEFKVEGDDDGGGDRSAIRLRGEVQRPGEDEPRPFDISDHSAFEESLALEIELQVGRGATLVVTFDAAAVLAVIDWDAVQPDDDGELDIDEDSPQIGVVRAALADAFSVEALP